MPRKGEKMSAEKKQAISQKLKGEPKSDEHKAKIAKSRKAAEPAMAARRATKRTARQQIRYEEQQQAKKENGGAYKPGQISKAPTTPEDRARTGPICGAKRTGRGFAGEGICCMPAGWGTEHKGVGACRYHAGTMPSHMTKAIKEDAIMKAIQYGGPIDIDPDTAVLQELCRTQGHVMWLSQQIELIRDGMLFTETPFGIKPSIMLQQYQEERRHLLKVGETAKRMGIQERQVRLAEEQGRLLAMVLKAFVEDPDLALTPTQRIASRELMRKHLLAVDVLFQEILATPAEAKHKAIEASATSITTD